MHSLFWISYGLLWLIVCVLVLLILLVYRQFGLMIMPGSQRIGLGGLDVGSRAPALPLRMEGRPETAYDWSDASGATFALFALPDCPLCEALSSEPATSVIGQRYPDIRFLWVSGAADLDHVPDGWRGATSQHGRAHTTMDIPGTPFAYLVAADATIQAKGLVNSTDDIAQIIADGTRRPVLAGALRPAPGEQ